MTTVTNLIEDVELYLEGVRIPTFNSIQISEQENNIPAAQISFAANAAILRVLPGTIVQVFAKTKLPDKDSETYLIFEGQVTQMNYSRGFSNDVVGFKAISLLSEMTRATLRYDHTIITSARNDAELNHVTRIRVDNALKDENGKYIFGHNSTVNKDPKNSPKHGQDYFEGTLDQLKEIASFGDIANTMASAMAAGTEASEGNFSEFLKEMNRFFMQSDIYYGIQSAAYKLGQSVITLPNKASGFDLKVAIHGMNKTFETMNKYPTGADMIHILMNLLNQFKEFLALKFICPASPIAAKYFHVLNDKKNLTRPVRMAFMPDFESAPPPLCNIFFPEQVTSMSFSRDFISEPTRVIGQLSYSFIKGGSIPSKMMPITVVPDVNLHKKDEDKTAITSKYTDEETYRGVVLKVTEHDGVVIRALYDVKNETTLGDKKNIAPLSEDDKKDINPALQRMVLNEYLTMKYGQRAVQLTAEWSPYRIVGLPGMVFEIGKPTIIGIIASITTQISADGQAQSQITMRNCKILFDETEITSTFVSTPATEKQVDRLEDYVVSDFVNGGFLGANPLLYKQSYYGMDNIGKEIYPYFMTGQFQRGNIYKFFKGRPVPYNIENATSAETGETAGTAEITLLYDTDKYSVTDKHKEALDTLKMFVGTAAGVRVEVEGYTDDVDTNDYNDALSKRRAEAAAKYIGALVKADIIASWKGESGFTNNGSLDKSREKARKVVIKATKPGNLKDYSIIRYVNVPNFLKGQENFPDDALEIVNTKLIYTAITNFKRFCMRQNMTGVITEKFIQTITARRLLTKVEYLASINEGLKLDDTTFNNWVGNSKDLQHIMQSKLLSYDRMLLTIATINDYYNKIDVSGIGYVDAKGNVQEKQQKEMIAKFEAEIKKLKADNASLAKKDATNTTGGTRNDLVIVANNKDIAALNKKISDVKKGIYRSSDDADVVRELLKQIGSVDIKNAKPASVREETSIFRPYNVTRRAHVQEIVKSFNYLKLTLPSQEENKNNPSNLIASR